MINRFFRPFLGGVFLDPDLKTSSRATEFALRMFASGTTALPAEGMGAISEQLASHLRPGTLRTQTTAVGIQGKTIKLASTETLKARAIVIATKNSTASKLDPDITPLPYRRVACSYYAASDPPVSGPYLILNGDGTGPINNLCVITQVAPTYAPANQQLISISVVNPPRQHVQSWQSGISNQLHDWFGSQVKDWRHLQTYFIKEAQPAQEPPFNPGYTRTPQLRDGIFVCGDYCSTATIDGALLSGRRAAESVLQELK